MLPAAVTHTCERCLFQQRVCLCADIPVIETRTRVLIVRHHSERFRSSNSGRLAHLALPNSAIVEHGGTLGPAALTDLEDTWLVFPEGEPRETIATPPRQLIFLDATWSQARRMYRKLAALRGLPILRLPARAIATVSRMREAPTPDRVSTIEAIAQALRMIEGDAVGTALEDLFQLAVQRAAMTGRTMQRDSANERSEPRGDGEGGGA
ncbi:MAG: tRNA-uridine aminocarboxypropyltransferase [Kofleriaceae bacterium]